MTLRLRFQNSGAQPGARAAVEMTGGALTVGRGEENDLALPDPERTLSKRHCVIEARGGDYVVVDLSTNGTYLNYAPERLGDVPTPLNDGDVIGVGGYELAVEISAAPLEAAGAGTPPPSPAAPPGESALDALGEGLDEGDDILGEILGARSAEAARGPEGWAPAPAWHGPFAGGSAPDAAWPAPGWSTPDGASAPDHAPAAHDHFQAPRAAGAAIPEDWDQLFEAPAGAPPLTGRADPFAAPPAPGAAPPAPGAAPATPPFAPPPDEPPLARPVPGPPAAPAPAPPDTAPDAARDAAARAFLVAAGMGRAEIPEAELAETLARMGRVFAVMVGGLREILITRASIKGEMRMDRTMISRGANNPLKFSISAEQAVEAMIRPGVPGYLEAEAAATEALDDIKAHEVAMMSGMQAALKDLLARLGPEALAARIETGSSLGGLLGGKKARYWEAYEKMYAQIARETEDDFQSTFGKEFARAYAAQLDALESKT